VDTVCVPNVYNGVSISMKLDKLLFKYIAYLIACLCLTPLGIAHLVAGNSIRGWMFMLFIPLTVIGVIDDLMKWRAAKEKVVQDRKTARLSAEQEQKRYELYTEYRTPNA
jgi:hypothetical protein